jgi:hypothetical protein
MPLYAKKDTNYENPKPGLHQAVCAHVVDIGWHETDFNGHKDYGHQIIILWELKSATTQGKRFQVAKFFTLSLGDKANLRKDLEAWLGRNLTEQEIKEGYDIESMAGVNCHLNLKIEERNGKTRAIIAGISPLMEGMAPIQSTVDLVPEWIDKIAVTGLKEKPKQEEIPATPNQDGLPF